MSAWRVILRILAILAGLAGLFCGGCAVLLFDFARGYSGGTDYRFLVYGAALMAAFVAGAWGLWRWSSRL